MPKSGWIAITTRLNAPLPRQTTTHEEGLIRSCASGVSTIARPLPAKEMPAKSPNVARPAAACCGSASRRSEEHTSELQSRGHLVCRLLLEKKKTLEGR